MGDRGGTANVTEVGVAALLDEAGDGNAAD